MLGFCTFASVLSLKSVAYIVEPSAAMARRADEGISGIFREGPTPPAPSRADEICKGLQGQDARGAITFLIFSIRCELERRLMYVLQETTFIG